MRLSLALALGGLIGLAASGPIDSGTTLSAQRQLAPENESITQADMRADLFFLASDEMRGRLVGTPESRLAAQFVGSRLERAGVQPAGPGGSYFQPFALLSMTLGERNELAVTGTGDSTLRFRSGQDFHPLRFSPSGRAAGEVVFAGFGITSPERDHDDLDDSVAGTIVLVLDHEPGERDPDSVFDGLVTSEAARDLRKALNAQRRGAAGILFVTDVQNHPQPPPFQQQAASYWPEVPRRVKRFMLEQWVQRVRIPAARVSPALAGQLVEGSGRSLEELARAAETAGGITPVAVPGSSVSFEVEVDRHLTRARNVVGMIEGADASLRDEWVVITAHYDHEGADGAAIYNGADDDGSGTVALIDIAEAYGRAAAAGSRPRRSVMFAAWDAEERGLLGAWAYTESPLAPLDRTVAVLNMDMIGRNEEVPEGGGGRFRGLELQTAAENATSVNIMGYSYSPELAEVIRDANSGYDLRLKLEYDNNPSNLLRRSDQWPFLQNGVPAIFFHTGLHPDYHTRFDAPEKINYAKMETIARLVHEVSWRLANQEGRPHMGRAVR